MSENHEFWGVDYTEILKNQMNSIPEINESFVIDINGNLIDAVYRDGEKILDISSDSSFPPEIKSHIESLTFSSAVTYLSVLKLKEHVQLGLLENMNVHGDRGALFIQQIDLDRFLLSFTTGDLRFGLMYLDMKRTADQLMKIPYQLPRRKTSLEEKLQQLKDEFRRGIHIFISYATKDADRFRITEVAESLTSHKEVETVLCWQKDAHGSLIEYMNENVPKCDIFLLCCSQAALQSDPIRVEWETAHIHKKYIIPIFESVEDIPPLLKRLRGIHFQSDNFEGTLSNLYQEILDIYASGLP